MNVCAWMCVHERKSARARAFFECCGTNCASQEVARQRGGYGEERYEKEEFQNKVRKVFDQLRLEDPGMWHVVDASLPLDDVTAKVWLRVCV